MQSQKEREAEVHESKWVVGAIIIIRQKEGNGELQYKLSLFDFISKTLLNMK